MVDSSRPDEAEFDELRGHFGKEQTAGQRSIVGVDLDRVQGVLRYAVPTMEVVAQRTVLDRYHQKKDPASYVAYAATKNGSSIDGLPALSR